MDKLKILFTGLMVLLLLTAVSPGANAEDPIVRTPEEILAEAGDVPTPEAIHELFINCSEWDEPHADVRDSSRQALVDMGVPVVQPLLDEWIASVDLRRRIELDDIITKIGNGSTPYLIPYLINDDFIVRNHAAYLIGTVAFIKTLEDPKAVGPTSEDKPALDAVLAALQVETDWHVTRTLLTTIGEIRDPTQIELIATYLTNEEEAVRLGAVIGLGRIPTQASAAAAIRGFTDRMMSVRQAAVLAVSTPTLGKFAFDALLGGAVLSPAGESPRLCSMEALWRYLSAIATDHSDYAWEQRRRAYSTAVSIIDASLDDASWRVRGYAVEVIGYTYGGEAVHYLEALKEKETNPFVIGKIDEALERLDAGIPEPPEPVEE